MHSQDESKFNLSHCTKCGKLLKKNSRSLITFEEHKVKSSKSKSTVPLLLLKFQKKIMMFCWCKLELSTVIIKIEMVSYFYKS